MDKRDIHLMDVTNAPPISLRTYNLLQREGLTDRNYSYLLRQHRRAILRLWELRRWIADGARAGRVEGMGKAAAEEIADLAAFLFKGFDRDIFLAQFRKAKRGLPSHKKAQLNLQRQRAGYQPRLH